MTKVTINPKRGETPSEQIVKSATEEFTVVDARGRSISLKKPGILAQYRLVEAIGSDAAMNQVYMSMVLPIIFVTAIDGAIVPVPTNKTQIEGLISRLDDDGVTAVAKAVQEHFGEQDPEGDRDALKK